MRRIVILLVFCAVVAMGAMQVAGDDPAPTVMDSQAFLQQNMHAGGPAADKFSGAVDQLIGKMTLKEKIGQMTQLEIGMVTDGNARGIHINPDKLHKAIGEYGVGSILNVSDEALPVEHWQEIIRAIQAEAKKTRLQIPVLYGLDTIHGANYVAGSTLFPQPLGMAATWNPELMLRGSQIAAAETRKAGVPWTFSPVMDAGRQQLWSRLWETFGEDTYLASVMGVAAVRGYEGDDLASPYHVSASLKHYIGYSYPTTGWDRSAALIPEGTLREYFLPNFAAAVKAGAHTVMVNSSEVNGVPGHANHYLLNDVLRTELGFQGFVVSDWTDIKKLVGVHHIAADEKEATRISVLAGVDMSMVPSDYSFADFLQQLVKEGKVPESRINEAVRRILMVKYQLGLFEDGLRGIEAKTVVGSPESRKVSLEAAQESIVLLKNKDKALPLKKSLHVLVTGPNADSLMPLNNGWTYTWQGARESAYPKDYPTIQQAIQSKVGSGNVEFERGATFDQLSDTDKAVAAAAKADVIVACVGERAYAETPGNIPDLSLPDAQQHLIAKLYETKKPVVLVLTEGRPRVIRRLVEGASAIVLGLNPGNEGGQAIADILFGDVNPSGKLPITYPRWPNALFTYDHKVFEGGDNPQDAWMYAPQFEFGTGLSYTTFAYADLEVTPASAGGDGPIHVSVTVKNTGERAGKEVVQLYLSARVRSITPEQRRLKRFAKVALQPGESRKVAFDLIREDFSFIGAGNKRIVEPGLFALHVAGLSKTLELK